MHTVPQNKDEFTINNLSYCCEALIFTQPLVYEFLCGLIFMAHPVRTLKCIQVSSISKLGKLLLHNIVCRIHFRGKWFGVIVKKMRF